jgi:hypothetical protein
MTLLYIRIKKNYYQLGTNSHIHKMSRTAYFLKVTVILNLEKEYRGFANLS